MASLQSDLANQAIETGIKEFTAEIDNAAGDCRVKLNRRSLGGLAFDVEFVDEGGDSKACASGGGGGHADAAEAASPSRKAPLPSLLQQQQPPLSAEEIAERLAAAEERRLGRVEEVKQRARGLSAGAKERSKAVREKLEATKQTLEVELDRDIRTKEARRREQIEKIVQGAQQHLAKVEGVRNQRLSTGPEHGCGDSAGAQSE